MNALGLFDGADVTPDACPYCGAAVLHTYVDTGSPMRAEPTDNGPYVLDSGLLRWVDEHGHALVAGDKAQVLRHAPKSEQRWASHFYRCARASAWSSR